MSKAVKTFYLLHGDDDFGLEQELAAIRKRMGDGPNADLNTDEFDGTVASVPEVLNAVSSYPFLADRRLVIVRGMLGWITRKGAGETGKQAVEALLNALPTLPETARLVFVERGAIAENSKLVKLARENPAGYEKLFASPSDATGWIMRRAKDAYETEIQPAAASALAEVTGHDLRRADSELVKLASYIDGAHPITEEDVALLTPYVSEARVFDMVDAVAEGRAGQALQMLHRLLMEKDQDPFKIYGMIIRQFRLLLTAKEYLLDGGYPNQMADALKMNSFVAKKVAVQSRAFSLAQLDSIYHALLDTDLKMKTGQLDPTLALDLLIASLA